MDADMVNDDFRKFIRPDRYQVFLMACPVAIPFHFASHTWIVANKKGKVSRWEVLFRKNKCKTSWNHLHQDFLPPFRGIETIPYWPKYFQKSRIVGIVEGNEGSTAHKMTEFVENSKYNYPYRDRYFYLGPNCNTFTQWAFDHFPDAGLTLPANAIGKGFPFKQIK
ncbi:MAG: DUF3750 domain-containing protein [Candidatus Niyogibacteria bacterium]|nr:DUF3750 domain-containing protein [Candidatus Niyogibacteria bacterium]